MKKWTQHEARLGNTVSPEVINDEMSSAASSIQTLDRSQLPPVCADASNLALYALHRVWCSERVGATGEQTASVDTTTASNMWESLSYQNWSGTWLTAATFTLTGFKGGSLFLEWSGNGYVYPAWTNTDGNLHPGNPKYLKVRILVAGVVIAERLGCASHEHWRLFGTSLFPQGDHEVVLQFQPTPIGVDDAIVTSGGTTLMQAHLYSSKYFAIGRFR